MKKLIQSRLHDPPHQVGNCFPTVIACLMDLDDPEEVIQIQEFYDDPRWIVRLLSWLHSKGYIYFAIGDHDSAQKDEYYLVSGKTSRFGGKYEHICIYQNSKMVWDPHPSGIGLLDETYFEVLKKVTIT